jgi:predicted DCC family thiol-disulfide oxidoreductase YuxK
MKPEREATATATAGKSVARGQTVLFYDGVCGLCSRLVRFLLARDRSGRIQFAVLQSAFASEVLPRHGHDAARLDTVYLLTGYGTPEERVLRKSRAVLAAVAMLPAPWKLAAAFRVVPGVVLDFFYDLVARVRYRVFGRTEHCRVPAPSERSRFIDGGPGSD